MQKLIILAVLLLTTLHAVDAPITVACVGDSITQGTAIKDNKDKYPAVLADKLGAGYTVKNFGHGGCTLLTGSKKSYNVTTEYTAASDSTSQIVVIMLGSNDAMFMMKEQDRLATDATALVKHFAALPSTKRVLINLPPPIYPKDPADAKSVAAAKKSNDAMTIVVDMWRKVAADEKLQIVDVHAALTDKPELFADGVHPNVDGAKILAQAVAQAILAPPPANPAP